MTSTTGLYYKFSFYSDASRNTFKKYFTACLRADMLPSGDKGLGASLRSCSSCRMISSTTERWINWSRFTCPKVQLCTAVMAYVTKEGLVRSNRLIIAAKDGWGNFPSAILMQCRKPLFWKQGPPQDKLGTNKVQYRSFFPLCIYFAFLRLKDRDKFLLWPSGKTWDQVMLWHG